jgi:hypothetical protein
MLRTRPHDSEGDDAEDGVTIVEVLLVIVITGLIMSGLTMVLTMGVRFGGQTQSRSQYGTMSATLSYYLGLDTANAETIANDPNAYGIWTDTTKCDVGAFSWGWASLGKMTLSDGTVVKYTAWTHDAGDPSVNEVQVRRQVGSGADTTIVRGFCTKSATGTFVNDYNASTGLYTLTLQLRTTNTSEVRTFAFGAAKRDTCDATYEGGCT